MLCQLSYAPRVGGRIVLAPRAGGLPAACSGQWSSVDSHEENEKVESGAEDPLLAAQEGKGYGEDEGEREDSLGETADPLSDDE